MSVEYVAGDVLEYAYTGAVQTLTLKAGKYQIEAWGAQGGYYSATYGEGGKGAYARGELTLTVDTLAYIRVGGAGGYVTATATWGGGGWNGGGDATYYGGGGGGASDIRLGADTLAGRVLIAAGGGGAQGRASASYKASGGHGGAAQGGDGEYYNGSTTTTYNGKGATQTAGGACGTYTSYPAEAGTVGQGGKAGRYTSTTYRGSGAGGGGFYGGGGGTYRYAGGGGGSSYTDATMINTAVLIAGNAAMTDPDGSTVTGHSGNGYVRITVIACGVPPQNLRTESDYTSVTISWDPTEGADNYNVYRDGDILAAGITATAYTDIGLLPDTTHIYGVSAVTDGQESSATTVRATTEHALLIRSPDISTAIITPNPTTINAGVTLIVMVEDETMLYTPRWYLAAEIYAGEDI